MMFSIMWQPNSMPVRGSLGLSALVAALPVFVMLFLLGVKRTPAWVAALCGLCAAAAVALFVYQMPAGAMLAAMSYGAAFGLFPIAWIVVWAILLYRLTLETGSFEILKDSIGGLTRDRRLQALLIAFAFGAFLEGAAGFGAPVAIAAAMLTGLGFTRFNAAGICLLANTAPVAFGSIGIPILTLAAVTGLPVRGLSLWVGRICAPVSLFIPAYLILVMGGLPALKGVLPAALLCGVVYAGAQLLVSSLLGPQLAAILSSLAAMGSLVVLFKFWKPKDQFALPDEPVHDPPAGHGATSHPLNGRAALPRRPELVRSSSFALPNYETYGPRQLFMAWLPYILLVLLVFLWGLDAVKKPLDRLTVTFQWPGLHSAAQSTAVAAASSNPAAVYKLNWMTASGTACMIAVLLTILFLRVTPRRFGKVAAISLRQLAFPVLTIAAVLSFAFLMNYSGATATLGLAFASTGRAFPFFSALLGWLGVFLVGSDTSSNALFGNLQTVTAGRLGLDPILMAAANSSGGVMGKMISLSSIAVAAAATGLPASDEARLFRFTLKHSLILATAIGLVVALYAWCFT
jgi:lactate permease